MTTPKTEQQLQVAFALAIVTPESTLPAAIEWVQDNLQPQDVFTNEQLEAWARTAGFQRPA